MIDKFEQEQNLIYHTYDEYRKHCENMLRTHLIGVATHFIDNCVSVGFKKVNPKLNFSEDEGSKVLAKDTVLIISED
jgi:hypothetical protein